LKHATFLYKYNTTAALSLDKVHYCVAKLLYYCRLQMIA